ncbi:unnamed protein product [Owenia fusiformis]|uniref:protein acetyllysine N-acetyltransferase n=1 Tax=Owenia fusiformis TaxID=6347 RepID=A0A8J1XZM1_OWEFU|nr:unnamed protein product [Owenia fusiformis]
MATNSTHKCCCFKQCTTKSELLDPENSSRVEVKTTFPKSLIKSKSLIDWSSKGEAKFHLACWELIQNASKSRGRKQKISLTNQEKAMVKEASDTAEFHDSHDVIKEKAAKVAELIKKAKHCVVFTGAGISTSAGIGDYRGKSGKWTEMDRQNDEPEPKKQCKEPEDEAGISHSDSEDGELVLPDEDGVDYEDLRPTYTHEALKKLVDMNLLKYVISQNGDGLHGLSGIPREKLAELHGNVFIEKCESAKQSMKEIITC